MRCAVSLVLLSLLVLRAAGACAHAAWPVYIDVREAANGPVRVRWQVPEVMPYNAVPAPVLPAQCTPVGPVQPQPGRAFVFVRHYRCAGGLAGQQLGIHYPQHNPSLTTLYHVQLASGTVLDHVLAPDESSWTVPATASSWRTAGQYVNLGIHHILQGTDHLLFVLCLMIIAGTGRRLLVTVTGFTLGHSITLALATLGVVTPPAGPIEAGIALSIALLAAEIIRNDRTTLTWRRPAIVSIAFGLLHGFGFSSVLRESGLPTGDIPTALLGFNIGVEIGQLLFVVAVLLLAGIAMRLWGLMRRRPLPLAKLSPAVAYGVGAIAAFWYVQRVATFWVS